MAQVDLKEQLTQLEAARNLVLSDAALYPQVLQGILPIIGANARLDLRRWGADFLAETFANTTLPSDRKEQLAGTVLPTLNEYLGNDAQDVGVIKSTVQTASSLYPFVFRHMYVLFSRKLPLAYCRNVPPLDKSSPRQYSFDV